MPKNQFNQLFLFLLFLVIGGILAGFFFSLQPAGEDCRSVNDPLRSYYLNKLINPTK